MGERIDTTKTNTKRKWEISLLVFIFVSIFFLSFIKPVSAQQESLYCAERTASGAYCQMVNLNEVDIRYNYQQTSCENTEYCSSGTCVNRATGECMPSSRATCNLSDGGYFYDRPRGAVNECKVGCCIFGDSATMVERIRCDVLGADYNVRSIFYPEISDENTCLSLAGADKKGACVFETERGRECKHLTRRECQNIRGEFSEGFLCTNPELGTICSKTKQTTCVEGKNEVYFIDSCGNIANVYNSNKVDDTLYWSYFPGYNGVSIDPGDNNGNELSQTNGMCDYIKGTTCGRYNPVTDGREKAPLYGNYICKSLNCKSSELTLNLPRRHGESWCYKDIREFENAVPGELSYLLYCYNGEVFYELCDPYRNKLCYNLTNITTGRTTAACIPNLWQDCILQESKRDCLNTEERDCKVLEFRVDPGVIGIVSTNDNKKKDFEVGPGVRGVCVPKYKPAFKFWEMEGTFNERLAAESPGIGDVSTCRVVDKHCKVEYHLSPITGAVYKAYQKGECFPNTINFPNIIDIIDSPKVSVNDWWATSYVKLCNSVGDCGVSKNYKGTMGSNMLEDLFTAGPRVRIPFESIRNSLINWFGRKVL